ncbi:hypothetical protein BC938DRAFT_472272 [Jimgerdemannia flammicorona]|uniref:Uncharacterized protein n=1 Tax=Jimgerdemannia flammicorona TaxID=994334 RepID=A0A433Q6F7_9FUNG|nr:hypothetical protein BC938DRAFT_472272 [Jimgerdemannia flammicorona]
MRMAAGSANAAYLEQFARIQSSSLAKSVSGRPEIISAIYIHPSAHVDPKAKIGFTSRLARTYALKILSSSTMQCSTTAPVCSTRCLTETPRARIEGIPMSGTRAPSPGTGSRANLGQGNHSQGGNGRPIGLRPVGAPSARPRRIV